MIVCAATNNAGKLKELRRILTRCGLHCAPSAHKTLGTFPQGTVRFSLGWASTEADVDAVVADWPAVRAAVSAVAEDWRTSRPRLSSCRAVASPIPPRVMPSS